jgi:multiple sugar transport system permease protein
VAQTALSPAGSVTHKPLLNHWRREALTGYLFALPWIFGFLTLLLGPMLFALYASFTRYNVVSDPQWIGLNNYAFIFTQDERFRIALTNQLYYVAVKTPVVIVAALLLAMLLNVDVPGQRLFRTIVYMPTIVSGVAMVYLWVWVMNPEGLLNRGLDLVGIRGPNWFYDPAWTKNGLVVMQLWVLGNSVLLLLAGLKGIPRHLYEAAEIDGAGAWSKFWNVTVPMLSPTLFYVIVTSIIFAFQAFDHPYVISSIVGGQGGSVGNPGDPAQSLLFYEIYLFLRAFRDLEMGFASALAWILFVIIMAFTAIQFWISRRWVHYEA